MQTRGPSRAEFPSAPSSIECLSEQAAGRQAVGPIAAGRLVPGTRRGLRGPTGATRPAQRVGPALASRQLHWQGRAGPARPDLYGQICRAGSERSGTVLVGGWRGRAGRRGRGRVPVSHAPSHTCSGLPAVPDPRPGRGRDAGRECSGGGRAACSSSLACVNHARPWRGRRMRQYPLLPSSPGTHRGSTRPWNAGREPVRSHSLGMGQGPLSPGSPAAPPPAWEIREKWAVRCTGPRNGQ
jgi:hypothetical protein